MIRPTAIMSTDPAMATMERLTFSENIRTRLPRKMASEMMAAAICMESVHLCPGGEDGDSNIHARSHTDQFTFPGDNRDVMQVMLQHPGVGTQQTSIFIHSNGRKHECLDGTVEHLGRWTGGLHGSKVVDKIDVGNEVYKIRKLKPEHVTQADDADGPILVV